MAFTYDITTDRGKVRSKLADTLERTHAFSDAEIDELLTEEGSVYGAAAAGLDLLIMDRARRARLFTDAQGSVDETATLDAMREQRDHYRAQAGATSLPILRSSTLAEPDWAPEYT